ncbi:XRE family transcriptional regulator [Saccharothrix australiensis]|uniref:AAA ATPase-like protein n=1 Tax=Saccharothrix australiensis TaxID=2072 RepID=A0A495VY35_9PSEU|nr:XRE family transcriptional regulator [Saccharothrix australiensis]RKT54236.1 AAA ATPase-like protein [Saccharothrix australiensis]
MADQYEFASLLTAFRREAGLTQRQLAESSQLSERALRDLERGRVHRPRQSTLNLLADALGLDDARERRFKAAAVTPRRAAECTASRPGNGLVGRRAELDALIGLLRSGEERLISVIGMAGAGKSRLLREVATAFERDPEWSVVRYPVDAPAGAVGRVPAERPGTPGGVPAAARPAALGPEGGPDEGHHALLVVDKAEEAARDYDFAAMLRRAPRLRVIAAERMPAVRSGRYLFPLAPLRVPDAADEVVPCDVTRVESVRLFLDAAKRAGGPDRPFPDDLAAVVELCAELDGLPGALAAAAAWSPVYTPRRMLALLRRDPGALLESPGGDGGLWNSMVEAVLALHGDDRAALARLATTGGCWSIDAGAALLDHDAHRFARLVHCLLSLGFVRPCRRGGNRFSVLNTVRGALTAAA